MNESAIKQKIPTSWDAREILRNKGQFWTPTWVAKAMVSYVAEESNLIFDPATGKGAFLDALLELNKPDTCFYGTDIDAEILKEDIYKHHSCKVELKDFIKNPPSGRFKAIVANPPYIRHHRLDEHTKAYLKSLSLKIAGFSIDGRAGYHIYFLLQALDKLENDGRLAIIMPADTCEGIFARKLWDWISRNYCIEAVATFAEKATPFPSVDTNAIVFFIKKSKLVGSLLWIKAKEINSSDLTDCVTSKFQRREFATLDITERTLDEAITTGLSRPQQETLTFKYYLKDFAKVMRGVATGANEFFFLTREQVKQLNIPGEFLKRAVGRTKDISGNCLTKNHLKELESSNRPTFLLSLDGRKDLPKIVTDYLQIGEEMGLPERSLIKQRKPWYKMEKREIPPLLFAYLGRRNIRFIKNDAGVIPLTSFLCIYPLSKDNNNIDNLWQALNHPATIQNLKLVGKSYGSGAIKVEPKNLSSLPIPETVVKQFNLQKHKVNKQNFLFD